MKSFIIITIPIISILLCSCEDQKTNTNLDHSKNDLPAKTPLEIYIDSLIENTTEERKAEICSAPMAELTVDHFGAGLALRTGELNSSDSEVLTYLTRNGIWHRDDLSTIVLLSYARKIRGEDLDIEGQFKEYRDYWAKEDIIAPTDIKCPTCKSEMNVYYRGMGGVNAPSKQKNYFGGDCPKNHHFLFYHKDGWVDLYYPE